MARSWRNLAALLIGGLAGAALGLATRGRRYSLSGKVVLLTGGSRGLGLLMARQLAAEGARLALVARNAPDLERAAGELRRRGAEVLTLPADVGDRLQVEDAVDATVRHFGALDVLINNAGVIQVGPLENQRLDDFETAMNVHFWGPLYAVRAARPYLERSRGRVVNVASIAGNVAVPHLLPYSASKFALVGLSDGLRAELAKDGIKVTTVLPWLTRTGSYRNVTVRGQHEEEFAWFAVSDSLPLLTMRGEGAAEAILDALRRGAPRLILTPYGKAATALDALFPQLIAAAAATANRLLPDAAPGAGTQKGYESFSALTPGWLTGLSDDAAARNNQLGGERRRR